MRERKTSVLPQYRVEGLAWRGYRQTFGPNLGFKFDMRERKTSVLPECKVEGLAWWG